MLKKIIFFTLLLYSTVGYSQYKKQQYIEKLIDSAYTYGPENSSVMKSIGKILVEFDATKKNSYYKIVGYHMIGTAHYLNQEIDSVYIAQKKGIAIFNHYPQLINLYSEKYIEISFGIYYFELSKGNYHRAFKILNETLKNIKKHDYQNKARIYLQLGKLNLKMNYYKEAKKAFDSVLRIDSVSTLTKNLTYMSLGVLYLKNNLDSAYAYYKKAGIYFNAKEKSGKLLTHYSNNVNIAEVLIKKGKLDIAKKILNDVEKYQLKKSKALLSRTYILKAEIAHLQNETKEEYNFLQMADKSLKKGFSLLDKEQLYRGFSRYYEKNNEFDTKFLYDLKARKIRDSLFNKEKIFLAKKLEFKYQTQLKEEKIILQEEQLRSQKTQNTLLLLGLILLVSLIVDLITLYRERIKTQKKLFINQEELALEKINTLIESEKVKSMQSHLAGQNKERERIAKDLHDSISGNLAAIKMKLTNIKNQELDSIIKSVDDTYNEVRTTSHNLLPAQISEYDFVTTIHQLMILYQSENLELSIEAFPKEEINQISKTIQTEIYRVLQELITNVVKHASATKVLINITLHDNYLNLLIEDNGVGYIHHKKNNGIGLKNITSRIKLMHGIFDIDSSLDKGTTVNINIPIK